MPPDTPPRGSESRPLTTETKTFLDWFVEEYDVGLPSIQNFATSMAYLQGLIDAKREDQGVGYLIQCHGTLNSAKTIVELLDRYKVKAP